MIKFCAEKAFEDNLHYFWVHTSFIDKSNHAALETAITSMFRWYRNVTTCYVYLVDVSILGCNIYPKAKKTPWQADIGSIRWFTRGWIL